ncbi:P-loop NTPase fold protein [Clostridium sp.]|uniref:P-loop NTPase fold protein n=1 Tax=Clostridium sp. TaxID=1506 RepID=UPI003216F0D0
MHRKYSLSSYRANNIIEPITEEQTGFFFVGENVKKQICELQNLIKEDTYGCYLISGMKGIGKTSFINTTLSNLEDQIFKKSYVTIKLNSTRVADVNNLFSLLIKELLRVSKDKNSLINVFYNNLRKIELVCSGNLQVHWEEEAATALNEGVSSSFTKEEQVGVDVTGAFKLPLIGRLIRGQMSNNFAKTESESNTKRKIEYNMKEDPHELFRELLNEFESLGIRLIFIFDEVDKCSTTFLDEIFNQYKDLLTNFKIFSIFLTDEKTYKAYKQSRDSLLFTYFIKAFYLSNMSYEETLRYCFGQHCEEDLCNADVLYYISLGNTRVININYKTHFRLNLFDSAHVALLYKARLFHYIIESIRYDLDVDDMRMFKKDMLKVDVKALIEFIFDIKECQISTATDYFNNVRTNRYPEANEILECIRNYKDSLEMKMVKFENDRIIIGYDKDMHLHNSWESLEAYDHNLNKRVTLNNRIRIESFYPFYEKGLGTHTNGIGTIQLVKLGDNEPESYEEAMEHLIISNYFNINKIIWLKRVRDGGKTWYTDEEYSLLVIIDSGIGIRYAFYNEAGSYSSEESRRITDLLKKIKDLGINYTEKTFSNGETSEQVLQQIIDSLDEF